MCANFLLSLGKERTKERIQNFVSSVLTTLRLFKDDKKQESKKEKSSLPFNEGDNEGDLFATEVDFPFDFVAEWVALQIQFVFPLPTPLLVLVVSFLNSNRFLNRLEKLYQAFEIHCDEDLFWKQFESSPGSRICTSIEKTGRRTGRRSAKGVSNLAFFSLSHPVRDQQEFEVEIGDSNSFLFGILFQKEEFDTYPCFLSASSPITLLSYWFGEEKKGLLVSETWQTWCRSLFPVWTFEGSKGEGVTVGDPWHLVFPFRASNEAIQKQIFQVWNSEKNDKTKTNTTTDWSFEWSVGFLHSQFHSRLDIPPCYQLFQFQDLPFFQLVELVVPEDLKAAEEGWSVRFFLHPPQDYLKTKIKVPSPAFQEENGDSLKKPKSKHSSIISSFLSLDQLWAADSTSGKQTKLELDQKTWQPTTPIAPKKREEKKKKSKFRKYDFMDLIRDDFQDDSEKGTIFVWKGNSPKCEENERSTLGKKELRDNQAIFESIVYLAPASLCVLRAERKGQTLIPRIQSTSKVKAQEFCMFNAVRSSFRLLEKIKQDPCKFPSCLTSSCFEIAFSSAYEDFSLLHEKEKRKQPEEKRESTPLSTFSYLKTKETELKLLDECFSMANWEWEATNQAKKACKSFETFICRKTKIDCDKFPFLFLLCFVFKILLLGSDLLELKKATPLYGETSEDEKSESEKSENDSEEEYMGEYETVKKMAKNVNKTIWTSKNIQAKWEPPSFLTWKCMLPVLVACRMFPMRLLSLFHLGKNKNKSKSQSKSVVKKKVSPKNKKKITQVIELFTLKLVSVFSTAFSFDHKSVECVYSPSKIENRLEFAWAGGNHKVYLYLNNRRSPRLDSYYALRSEQMLGRFQLFPFSYLPLEPAFVSNMKICKRELLTFTEPRTVDCQETEHVLETSLEWPVSSIFFHEFSQLVLDEKTSKREDRTPIRLPNLVFSHLFRFLSYFCTDSAPLKVASLTLRSSELGRFVLKIKCDNCDLRSTCGVFKILDCQGFNRRDLPEKEKTSCSKFSKNWESPKILNSRGFYDQEETDGFYWVFQENLIAFSRFLKTKKEQTNEKVQDVEKEKYFPFQMPTTECVDFSSFYEFKLIRCGSILDLEKFWNIDHHLSATSIRLYFLKLIYAPGIDLKLVFIQHSFEVLHRWELLRIVLDLTPAEFGVFLFTPFSIDFEQTGRYLHGLHGLHRMVFDNALIQKKSNYFIVNWLHSFTKEMEKQKQDKTDV